MIFLRHFFWLGLLVFRMALLAKEPDALYLTWIDDPTTTMTVVWLGGDGQRVMFRPVEGAEWQNVKASSRPVPKTRTNIHTCHIQNLKSNATYLFKIEGGEKIYRFQTLPQSLD